MKGDSHDLFLGTAANPLAQYNTATELLEAYFGCGAVKGLGLEKASAVHTSTTNESTLAPRPRC